MIVHGVTLRFPSFSDHPLLREEGQRDRTVLSEQDRIKNHRFDHQRFDGQNYKVDWQHLPIWRTRFCPSRKTKHANKGVVPSHERYSLFTFLDQPRPQNLRNKLAVLPSTHTRNPNQLIPRAKQWQGWRSGIGWWWMGRQGLSHSSGKWRDLLRESSRPRHQTPDLQP